eukprot:15477126-Alexandrium_andersonii.AAC.1
MVAPLSGASICTTVRNTPRRSVAAGPWPRSLLLTPPRSACDAPAPVPCHPERPRLGGRRRLSSDVHRR